jgi:ubiquinone/menaquinone biosynthesis C-methylase UbiE
MNPDILSLLCDPQTHEPLELADAGGERALRSASGRVYPLREGIPVFLTGSDLTGQNQRYERLYNRLAPVYDLTTRVYAWLKSGGEEKRRREYLDELGMKPGDRVLEVSIGTGANLKFLPAEARYFGCDLSWGMLMQCQHNLGRWSRQAELFLGAAERLPFRDDVFDVVFHMGGINFFNDRAAALREMIRVARPGTKLLIVDETKRQAKAYAKAPLSGRFYGPHPGAGSAPVDLLPGDMRDVHVRYIAHGELYSLTFRKPG